MSVLTHLAVWLNALANALGRVLAPIAWLPGWLSATLVAAVTGVVMLIAFKYTSNQRAIRRARLPHCCCRRSRSDWSKRRSSRVSRAPRYWRR